MIVSFILSVMSLRKRTEERRGQQNVYVTNMTGLLYLCFVMIVT